MGSRSFIVIRLINTVIKIKRLLFRNRQPHPAPNKKAEASIGTSALIISDIYCTSLPVTIRNCILLYLATGHFTVTLPAICRSAMLHGITDLSCSLVGVVPHFGSMVKR